MQYRVDSLGLSGAVTAVFRDLLHERLGLHYEVSQFDLVGERLAPLVVAHGLHSFIDYYYVLKYAADSSEWLRVMDALAVNESYFWREIDQLRAVVDHVVPRLVEAAGGRPVRLWSIPCATGEEPLTLAMLLSEAGWFERAEIEIRASDGSPALIARAREGRYGKRSFRNLPAPMMEKYFLGPAGDLRVVPALHRRVTFDVVNLMDADQVARHAAPVIVCRNVFIYFSDVSIRRVIDVFERSMPSPAYLCIGASESLLRHRTAFELQEIGGAFMYLKQALSEAGQPVVPGVERAS